MEFDKAVELTRDEMIWALDKLDTKEKKMNYLYFLRDELNNEIRKTKKIK